MLHQLYFSHVKIPSHDKQSQFKQTSQPFNPHVPLLPITQHQNSPILSVLKGTGTSCLELSPLDVGESYDCRVNLRYFLIIIPGLFNIPYYKVILPFSLVLNTDTSLVHDPMKVCDRFGRL